MSPYTVFCYDLPGDTGLRQSTNKNKWTAVQFFENLRAAVDAACAARLDWARVSVWDSADRNIVSFVGKDVYVDHVLKGRMSS